MTSEKTKILMVAVEAKPYATAGGTSDVVGALSKELRQKGCDVRLVLPYYSSLIREPSVQTEPYSELTVPFGGTAVPVTVRRADQSVYLLGGDPYGYFAEVGRDDTPLYPMLENGGIDAGRLYAFFCRAVLELLRELDGQGWRPDVVHCHDWPTGLVPAYAKSVLNDVAYLQGIRWVFTVHNMSGVVYQGGWFAPHLLSAAGLPHKLYGSGQVRQDGHVNFMKAGIVSSDRVNTVSAGYAGEVQSDRVETYEAADGGLRQFQYSGGLHGVWSQYHVDLVGIRNGIDDCYDPASIGQGADWLFLDQDWKANYAASAGRPMAEWAYRPEDPDLWHKKHDLKRYLQERCNRLLKARLELSTDTPVIAVRSRLTEQKGFDLILRGLEQWAFSWPVQFIVVAWGEERYATPLRELAARYPERIVFSESWRIAPELLHYAGADMLLMPSLFEPCGLPHMMALRYGTIPIVRHTGGLGDVVEDLARPNGNGFLFDRPAAKDMVRAVDRALQLYHERPDQWQALISTAMQARDRAGQDFTWATAADRYLAELYG